VADYKKSWWFQHSSEQNVEEAQLLEFNKNNHWTDRNVARRVLNYRHHKDPALQMNPSGKEWEHIHEASNKGEHSVKNLALLDEQINRDLGIAFGKSYGPGEVKGMPGTGGQKLRDFLSALPASEHVKWKFKFYDRYNLTLKTVKNEIGEYQVLD
jgi:hypothetical protein